jgi:hypothetical protein
MMPAADKKMAFLGHKYPPAVILGRGFDQCRVVFFPIFVLFSCLASLYGNGLLSQIAEF